MVFNIQEIYDFESNDISIRVKIDYNLGTISLLDRDNNPKQFVFANRESQYMEGWKNIVEAMKDAITHADNRLREYQEERSMRMLDAIGEVSSNLGRIL